MNNQKLDILINYLQSFSEELQKLKSTNSPYENELSATTTTIYLKTGTLYPWHELKKWCKRHSFTPKQITKYGLKANSYPASAWRDCYGIDLTDLSKSKALEA